MRHVCAKIALGAALLCATTAHAKITARGILNREGPGLSVAVGGTGLDNALRKGAIRITIPGEVQAAYLYWAGDGQLGPQAMRFSGTDYPGKRIGKEASSTVSQAYRADVTKRVKAAYAAKGPGNFKFSVRDLTPNDTLERMHGAGLLVIYTDPNDPTVYRMTGFDGLDYAWSGFDGELAICKPLTFQYPGLNGDRTGKLFVMVAECEANRPDRIDISDNPSITDALDGSSGAEWDTDVFDVHIPANATGTTVEVASPSDSLASDSLAWTLAVLRVPAELPPPPPVCDCCPDDFKPSMLVFKYTGQSCAASNHSQAAGKVSCSGDPKFAPTVHILASDKSSPTDRRAKVWFQGDVNLGRQFTLLASNGGATKFAADTWMHITNASGETLQTIKLHTSCSQPLQTGDQFGSVQLVGCSNQPPPPPPSNDFCQDRTRPLRLTMQYTGDSCALTHHAQADGKVTCSGDPAQMPIVHIKATSDADGAGLVWFDDVVTLNGFFDIDAARANQTKLNTNTHVQVFDIAGNLLQTVVFHTSCSQPLQNGDQYGCMKLTGFQASD